MRNMSISNILFRLFVGGLDCIQKLIKPLDYDTNNSIGLREFDSGSKFR